jgi:hypothetical protein
MFTVPDQPDSVATLPPFSPVGPHPQGFFADCNPAQNFDGTRPLAEHFNELIVNLRALLVEARIAPVKGDATMLWRAILNLQQISANVTFHVSSTGVADPADPFGGDPFDSLASAYGFLTRYRIAPGVTVVVEIAPGTYVSQPLTIAHPDGEHITIAGGGVANTILQYPTGAGGITLQNDLGGLRDLTISGQSTAASAAPWVATGLYAINASCVLGSIAITGFAGGGVVIGGGGLAAPTDTTVTITANRNGGIYMDGGNLNAGFANAIFTLTNNGGAAQAFITNGRAGFDDLRTSGGNCGLIADGPATLVTARKIGVDVATNTASIQIGNGAMLLNAPNVVAGDWWTWNTTANTAQYFTASNYGFIRAGIALAANNRTNCSPPLNTLGNTQAFIQAT